MIARLTGGPVIVFHQRQIDDDLRLSGVGDIDDRHRVLPCRVRDRLTGILVERDLLVVARDQELRPGGMCWCEQGAGSRT